MGTIDLEQYTVGNPVSTEDPKIANNFTLLQALLNGGLDAENLAAATKQALGLSDAAVVRRGKSIIATEEARANVAYGLMTTPDRVENVVLPSNGLIFVLYQALWQESNAGQGKADIFIGANQVKRQSHNTGAPAVNEAEQGGTTSQWRPLTTDSRYGLVSSSGTVNHAGDVTTGQLVGYENDLGSTFGGPCAIFAAAGTYTISIQFRAGAGSVAVKERKLWVWTLGF